MCLFIYFHMYIYLYPTFKIPFVRLCGLFGPDGLPESLRLLLGLAGRSQSQAIRPRNAALHIDAVMDLGRANDDTSKS